MQARPPLPGPVSPPADATLPVSPPRCRCFIPALFIAGKHDDFISPQHSQQIHDAYAGDKNLILVEGDHNSIRPRFMYHSVANFLQLTLQVSQQAERGRSSLPASQQGPMYHWSVADLLQLTLQVSRQAGSRRGQEGGRSSPALHHP